MSIDDSHVTDDIVRDSYMFVVNWKCAQRSILNGTSEIVLHCPVLYCAVTYCTIACARCTRTYMFECVQGSRTVILQLDIVRRYWMVILLSNLIAYRPIPHNLSATIQYHTISFRPVPSHPIRSPTPYPICTGHDLERWSYTTEKSLWLSPCSHREVYVSYACWPVGREMLRDAAASTARRRSFFIKTVRRQR